MSDYNKLNTIESREFIAKLISAIQYNDECFEKAKQIINFAELDGTLNKVKFFSDKFNA